MKHSRRVALNGFAVGAALGFAATLAIGFAASSAGLATALAAACLALAAWTWRGARVLGRRRASP